MIVRQAEPEVLPQLLGCSLVTQRWQEASLGYHPEVALWDLETQIQALESLEVDSVQARHRQAELAELVLYGPARADSVAL